MTGYCGLPPSFAIILYIPFAPVLFVIEEVLSLKETFIVTERINKIKDRWDHAEGAHVLRKSDFVNCT